MRPKAPMLAWALLWSGLATFLLLQGPRRGFFSGVPLSSKGAALAIVLVGLVCAVATFPPSRRARPRWGFILWGLVAAKLVIAPMLVPEGWQGHYATAQLVPPGVPGTMRPVTFTSPLGPSPYRIDRELRFKWTSFEFNFVNDKQEAPVHKLLRRDTLQPVRVLWRGWTHSSLRRQITFDVSASGLCIVRLDGVEVWRGINPARRRVSLDLPQGVRELQILYDKPAGAEPIFEAEGLPFVTASPADEEAIQRSRLASAGINVLGILALFVLAAGILDAYRPLRESLRRIDAGRAAALLFVAAFLILGLQRGIPVRGTTMQQSVGDDYLTYEAMARSILRGDVALLHGKDPGQGEPYYHYPLYPYVLAAAHYLFGDSFAAVILLNYVCLALLGLPLERFLRRHLPPWRVAAALVLTFAFLYVYQLRYAGNAYTDNLFLLLIVVALLSSVQALERGSTSRFVLTGVFIAAAAATRPTAFIYLPCFVLAVLIFRDLGPLKKRALAVAATIGGFAVAVSPFTFRNHYVTGRWVMLVGGYMAITIYLVPPEGGWDRPTVLVNGRMPTIIETLGQITAIVREHPMGVLWLEMRKVLFTFGWTGFGPARATEMPNFGLYFLLFLAALLSRRIPKATAFVLVTFLLSHVASLVMGAPWTYGYKSIIPFHLACLIGTWFLLKPKVPSGGQSESPAIPPATEVIA